MKHADQIDRILFEDRVVDDVEPIAVDLEVAELAVPVPEVREAQSRAALMLRFDRGAEDAGKIPDILGGQIIMFHEPLDRGASRVIGIAEQCRDLALQIHGQAFLRPTGEVVQVTPDRPKLLLRLGETSSLGERKNTLVHERADRVDLVDVFADPEQLVQIAKTALAFLDVGLDHIA